MDDIALQTDRAIAGAQAIVDRVCSACANSCCHQGTMMGTRDVLRLVKGMVLDPGREALVREGLRERAQELRSDLETLQGVRALLAVASDEHGSDLAALDASLVQWEELCGALESAWTADVDSLRRMLRFAGIWAMTQQALRAFPGAYAALSTLARPGSSFRFRGRRLAPPRCLFHSLECGCLAGRWKPGKCANFFCAGEPNVLRELRQELGFEDFVLSNATLVAPEAALETVRLELRLGREYVEPKVFVGLDQEYQRALRDLLAANYERIVEPLPAGGRFVQSVAEIEAVLGRLTPTDCCFIEAAVTDGFALYELAVALDRRRATGEAVALVVSAGALSPLSALAHPLWADAEMSQPLGVLDLYVVRPGAGD